MSILIIIGISHISLMFIILISPILPNLVRKLLSTENDETLVPRKNSDEISKWHFLEGAKRAKRDFRIVSGNLYPGTFDQNAVEELVSILTQNGKLKVRIFVGSKVLCIDKKGDNPFWQLYKSGRLNEQLEIRVLADYPEQHYRVIDKREFFLEEPHDAQSPEREFRINSHSCTNAVVYASEFDKAWDRTDAKRMPEFILAPATSE